MWGKWVRKHTESNKTSRKARHDNIKKKKKLNTFKHRIIEPMTKKLFNISNHISVRITLWLQQQVVPILKKNKKKENTYTSQLMGNRENNEAIWILTTATDGRGENKHKPTMWYRWSWCLADKIQFCSEQRQKHQRSKLRGDEWMQKAAGWFLPLLIGAHYLCLSDDLWVRLLRKSRRYKKKKKTQLLVFNFVLRTIFSFPLEETTQTLILNPLEFRVKLDIFRVLIIWIK